MREEDRNSQALARLAVLKRLLEYAIAGSRDEAVRSVQQLIEQETTALRKSLDVGCDASPGALQDATKVVRAGR